MQRRHRAARAAARRADALELGEISEEEFARASSATLLARLREIQERRPARRAGEMRIAGVDVERRDGGHDEPVGRRASRRATPAALTPGAGAIRRPVFLFFGGKGGVGKTTCAAAAGARRWPSRPPRARRLDRSRALARRRASDAGSRPSPAPHRRRGAGRAARRGARRGPRARPLARRAARALAHIAERGTYLDARTSSGFLGCRFPASTS